MTKADNTRFLFVTSTILLTLIIASFIKIYVRTQTTLIGYNLGSLKEKEADLLEELSRKKSLLASISTKSKLKEFARKDL